MPKTKITLTNTILVELLKQELAKFSDQYYPLHARQIQGIKRCTALAETDANEIGDNSPRRRAHNILSDLWTHVPPAFFLCGLSISPTELGTLKSIDYMTSILQWWGGVEVPAGLMRAYDHHSDILPTMSRDKRQIRQEVSLGELLGFLQQKYGQEQGELSLPFSGSPLPFVRLDRHTKIELSWDIANSFIQHCQTSN